MKKMMMAIVAMALSAQMMAQETKRDNNQRRQFDMTEMLKQRTKETAEKLGLNDEQTAKLLELNTQYADKLRPQMRGQRQVRPQGRGDGARDSSMRMRPERDGQQPAREDIEKMREDMKANQEAYDAELQKILTEEQYKAYKVEEQNRLQRAPRGGFGQRGQQNGRMRPQRRIDAQQE